MESNSRVEVLAEILLVARKGATKSQIFNRSSLPRGQVEECLCFLQQTDLLRRRGSNSLFGPTRKGARLIADYERIYQRIGGQQSR